MEGEQKECKKEEEIMDVGSQRTWWEVAIFRVLNGVMVGIFLGASFKLVKDDNSCLWVPTFLVPAFLSAVLAIK